MRHAVPRRHARWGRGGLLASGLLVAACAGAQSRQPTTPTGIGIFYQPGAPQTETLWQPGDPGQRMQLQGRVMTTAGAPIADALIEIWHADAESRYRTALRSRADGSFTLRTVLPGHIEQARNNSIWGARHIHVVVSAPGRPQLVTLAYFKGDERLDRTPYPELAITLEEARLGEESVLLGRLELILP
jgi:protocatechuate 3,4-dioxygenase beta subunit